MVHISVVTGERLFDVTPSLLAGSEASTDFKALGGILPAEVEALSLPVLDVSNEQRPLNCDTSLRVPELRMVRPLMRFVSLTRTKSELLPLFTWAHTGIG